jgi:4-amino-4-deoxy-L-arabinose transferase-like glycosyltransferase
MTDRNHSGTALGTHRSDLLVFLLLVSAATWQLLSARTTPTIWGDQHCYMTLADSLIAGHGYTINIAPETKYPPGFPFVLGIAGRLFGQSYHVYLSTSIIFGALGLFFAYLLMRHLENASAAAGAIVLMVASPEYFRYSTGDVLSELVFMAFLYATLIALLKADESRSRRWLLLASSLLAFTSLIRTVGIVLVAALCGWLLISRQARHSKTLSVAAAAGLAAPIVWFAYGLGSTATSGTYFGEFMSHTSSIGVFGKRIIKNLMEQGIDIASLGMIDFRRDWYSPIWMVPFALLTLYLLPKIIRRTLDLTDWFVIIWLGAFLVWRGAGSRFSLPVKPLLYLYCWRGMQSLAKVHLSPRPLFFAGFAAALGAAGSSVVYRFQFPSTGAMLEAVLLAAVGLILLAIGCSPGKGRWGEVFSSHHAKRIYRAAISSAGLAFCVLGLTSQVGIARHHNTDDRIWQPVVDLAKWMNRPEDVGWQPVVHLANWLNRHVPEGETILVEPDLVCDLARLTRIPVTNFPVGLQIQNIETTIKLNHVRYVAVVNIASEPFQSAPMAVLTRERPSLLKAFYEGPEFEVFKVGD